MEANTYEAAYNFLIKKVPELRKPGGIIADLVLQGVRFEVVSRDECARPKHVVLSADSVEFEVIISHDMAFAVPVRHRKGDHTQVIQLRAGMSAVLMADLGVALVSWLSAAFNVRRG